MRMSRLFVFGVSIFVVASFFVTSGFAGFEGFWLQTTMSESELSMTGKRSEKTRQKVYYKSGMLKIVDLNDDEITIVRMDKELIKQFKILAVEQEKLQNQLLEEALRDLLRKYGKIPKE